MIGTEGYNLSQALSHFTDGLIVFLIGVSMVFLTLILLILLIKLIGIIGKEKGVELLQQATSEIGKRSDEQVEQTLDAGNNAINDLELVAVITAALAASLEVTTDKLVVRSLRKINR